VVLWDEDLETLRNALGGAAPGALQQVGFCRAGSWPGSVTEHLPRKHSDLPRYRALALLGVGQVASSRARARYCGSPAPTASR